MSLEKENFDLNLMHLPVKTVLMTLLGLIFTGYLGGQLLVFVISYIYGVDLGELLAILNNEEADLGSRNLLRIITLINQLTIFLIPAGFLTWFIYKKRSFEFLKLNLNSIILLISLVAVPLLIMSFMPIVQLSMMVNQMIPLPDWATGMEEESAHLIKTFLTMESSAELLFTFFLMAIVPAVGEELLFRGVLQQTLQRHFQNEHITVWVAAFVFSFFHFQFEGLLPRMLLGALLGYLLVWTNNLWVPIFGHLFFNGIQVLAVKLTPDKINFDNMEMMDGSLPFVAYVISFIFVFAIIYSIRLISKQTNQNSQRRSQLLDGE